VSTAASHRTSIPTQPAAWRWLRRHLIAVIAVKLALLTLLYALFFSPAHRPDVDADAVGRRLESTPR